MGEKHAVISIYGTYIGSYSKYNNTGLYNISGYHFIKKNNNRTNGGVARYIPDNIKRNQEEDLKCETVEYIWIEIFPQNAKSFLVSNIY